MMDTYCLGYTHPKMWNDPRITVPHYWPWAKKWWKPKDRRRDLVRAAALLIAEIERLDRATTEPENKP